ncbi:MAG: hypothetical protein KGJ58_04490 [Patescibacteria group bacterium]|nr:hypothetical protein [Patescibacteria group bacterium]MDE1988221.1 hypothetical protein [Patescibacteria group bacterium]MDE2218671.1 hypothetical protein [Patescibacteria group bacterium]
MNLGKKELLILLKITSTQRKGAAVKAIEITDIQKLRKILLGISIDFFNINKLSESVISDNNNDCGGLSLMEKDALIKKACSVVSAAIRALKSVSEILLSSDIGEEKSNLAKDIRSLAYEMKIFLMVRSHILNLASSDSVACQCDNHKNIKTLTDIFMNTI